MANIKDLIIIILFLGIFLWACAKSLPRLEFQCDDMTYEETVSIKRRVAQFCAPKKVESIKICHNKEKRESRVIYKCLNE